MSSSSRSPAGASVCSSSFFTLSSLRPKWRNGDFRGRKGMDPGTRDSLRAMLGRLTFWSRESVQPPDGEAGEPGRGLILLLLLRLLLKLVHHHCWLGHCVLLGIADEDLVRHCRGNEKELFWRENLFLKIKTVSASFFCGTLFRHYLWSEVNMSPDIVEAWSSTGAKSVR